MHFVISWSITPENRDAVLARFKETEGAPPKGVKMLTRWHSVGGGRGFCVGESDDTVAVGKWVQEWSDLMSFEVYPALDDEGFVKMLGWQG
jgi:hypothetical protein